MALDPPDDSKKPSHRPDEGATAPSSPSIARRDDAPDNVDEQVGASSNAEALAALGLSEEDLHDAIRAAESARDGASPNYPWWFPHMLAAATIVKALRERLIPRGWAKRVIGRLDAVVTPSRRDAIVAWPGDENTGNSSSMASNRYAKGNETVDSFNFRQLELTQVAYPEEFEHGDAGGRTKRSEDALEREAKRIWVLLRRRDRGLVYSELAQVRQEDISAGFIGRVRRRILLSPLDLEATRTASAPSMPTPPPPAKEREHDVAVERIDEAAAAEADANKAPETGEGNKT